MSSTRRTTRPRKIAPIIAKQGLARWRKVSVDPEPERWEFDNLTRPSLTVLLGGIRRWVKMGFPAVAVPDKPQSS